VLSTTPCSCMVVVVPLHLSSRRHHTSYRPFSPSSGSRGSYSQLPLGLTRSTLAHPKECDVWQVGRLLVSRHASHVFVAHQYRALDVHQDRSAQRPRVCVCLGARAHSSPLICKPISLSCLLTHTSTPSASSSLPRFSHAGFYTRLVVSPNRAPNIPDRRKSTLKICPVWLALGNHIR